MAFHIPDNLPSNLMGVAWMIGRWQGSGHGSWPGLDDFDFGQQIDFTVNEGSYLHYISQSYTLDEQGNPKEPLSIETGFWRPSLDGSLEVVLASPEGYADIWVGKIEGAKIELVTDVVARTKTAEIAYTGGQRLYGNVEGDLLWTFDRASADVALQPYMWARLQRVDD